MAWKECSLMFQRQEFVRLCLNGQGSMTVLCERFGVSRRTGYKWLKRFKDQGIDGLKNQSRRPKSSPNQVDQVVEAKVVELRKRHRAWGGRKIRRRMQRLGESVVCAPSTITSILHRNGLIDPAESQVRRHPIRFCYPAPNDLWQMDFKGHFPLAKGGRCHPLTVLDDHSRYSIALACCSNEQTATVMKHLTIAFEKYGLPKRILCDNGSPWACSGTGGWEPYTPLSLWLLRLNTQVIHGRPHHPQTQGKDERFHRTMIDEVLRWNTFTDIAHSQSVFDPWRETYNTQRPHQALDIRVPSELYTPSPRPFPKTLPEIIYPQTDLVRKVSPTSAIVIGKRRFCVGRAFRGQHLGLRATPIDGVLDVYFCQQRVGRIDQRQPGPMERVTTDLPLTIADADHQTIS